MPIYDFKCRECGRLTEILCLGAEEQTVRCPDCGSDSMDRLISSSYLVKKSSQTSGTTCCGRAERCETPPCSTGDTCRRG